MDNSPHEHLFHFLKWLFSPPTLANISVYVGLGSGMVAFCIKKLRRLWHDLEKDQNEKLVSVDETLKEITSRLDKRDRKIDIELLRLQIVTGIASDQLSVTEVLSLYDRYKEYGGNSYITRLVNDYVRRKGGIANDGNDH